MAPVAILLRTVFESILEVFLLCLAGYILARRGILDKKTQKQLNRLNVSLFTPSLLFSKVAFFLSPAKLRELWMIPVFFVIVTSVSMSVSFVLGWIFRLKRSQRSFAIAASMFMNSNSLPIALMQSLVVTVPGLKWDDDDNEESMLGRALTYLVLYSTLGMVLRWSYGVHLLTQADPEAQDDAPIEEAIVVEDAEDESSPLIDDSPATLHDGEQVYDRVASVTFDDSRAASHDDLATEVEDDSKLLHPGTGRGRDKRVFYSFPNTPTRSMIGLPAVSSSSSLNQSAVPSNDSSDNDDDDALLLPGARRRRRHVVTPTSTRLHSFLRRTAHRIRKTLRTINSFMTVPLWAAAASLVVALVPPLQHTLDAHLQPIKGALSAAGNCSIPLTLVVLGAYFYTPDDPANADAKDAGNKGVLPSTITSANAQNGGGNVIGNGNGIANGNGYPTRRDASRGTERSSFVGSVRSMLRLSRLDGQGRSSKKAKSTGDARPGETRTVIIAVLSRMLLTPLLLLPLMIWAAKYDVMRVFDDPVFVVANVLLVSSPPALTLAQITQAASGDAFERLISRTIFWAYCIVTPPATIVYVVIGLLLAKL